MDRLILVVDDEKMITTTIAALIKIMLKQNVMTFNSPEDALSCEELSEQKVDLIISDFMMPGMNGIEFLKKVREKSPETVMILLTGYADKESAIKGINEVGLYYYIEKPWDNNELISIVRNGLEKKELTDSLEKQYEELTESHREIERLYDLLKRDYQKEVVNVKNLVITLANVIEAKDKYTEGHTRRVGNISRELGMKMGLSSDKLHSLEVAGIIHDIGKVGVSETILNKPGRLTPEEFEDIKRHTVMGETICKPLICLEECLDPIRHHHEKLDGSGYPDGLPGSDISLEARIIAVADIFDALYSDRPYRAKMPMGMVKEIIRDETQKGRLDSRVVDALFNMLDNNTLDNIIG